MNYQAAIAYASTLSTRINPVYVYQLASGSCYVSDKDPSQLSARHVATVNRPQYEPVAVDRALRI